MIKKIIFIFKFNKDLFKYMVNNKQTPFEWTVNNKNGVQSRTISMK